MAPRGLAGATARGQSMNLNPRQRKILQIIHAHGSVSVTDVAKKFSVTTQTARRDIAELCRQQLAERHHGGAMLPSSSVENIAYTARQTLNADAKKQIGVLVAQMIPESASLFINIGTTTEEVAKALKQHKKLRVITNNLNVAGILADNPGIELIVTGGLVRSRDRAVVGESAVDFIQQFKVDYGIIGVSGIEEDGTLLDFDYQEVRVAQEIIRNSRSVFLVADHSKINRNAMVRLGHFSEVSDFFTDEATSPELTTVLEEVQTKLHIAAPIK
jgi:DeoR family glycerol-3-phosphate regulon repressor|tara:strand:- start:8008 stop:8826 length:819 start_codon:yes stop_codon:yes gene_type:complete